MTSCGCAAPVGLPTGATRVQETGRVVTVQVVGEKVGNRLIVRGVEYTDHESH